MSDLVQQAKTRAAFSTEQDSDLLFDLASEITRLRAENERLREALRPIIAEARSVIDDLRTKPDHHNFLIAVTAYDLRAALEGVTEPSSPWRDIESAPNDQIILVYDKSASTKIVAAFLSEGGWLYAEEFEADPEGPIPTQWMPLPEPPQQSGGVK